MTQFSSASFGRRGFLGGALGLGAAATLSAFKTFGRLKTMRAIGPSAFRITGSSTPDTDFPLCDVPALCALLPSYY